MKFYRFFIITLVFVGVLQSCIPGAYKFNETSIDPNINTFYVGGFELRAPNAPPNLSNTIEQALNQKIRQESRLEENQVNPDIEFKAVINTYRVSSEAPQSDEQTAFNRLTIGLEIEYTDNKSQDEKRNWKQNFSRFADFDANGNLLDVQDDLIEAINELLMEDIFNKAFTDW